jgi:hypothetical protein
MSAEHDHGVLEKELFMISTPSPTDFSEMLQRELAVAADPRSLLRSI